MTAETVIARSREDKRIHGDAAISMLGGDWRATGFANLPACA